MNSLFRILGYLRPHRRLVLTTLSFATLTTIFDLLPPWLIKIIIDDVIQAERTDLLPWVLGGLVGAYGFKNILNSFRIRFNNILEQRVIFDLRQQVFRALQRLSISFYENRSTGERKRNRFRETSWTNLQNCAIKNRILIHTGTQQQIHTRLVRTVIEFPSAMLVLKLICDMPI